MMKKHCSHIRRILWCAVIILTGLTACKDDTTTPPEPPEPPFLEITTTEVAFSSGIDSSTIEVKSNCELQATSDQSWCKAVITGTQLKISVSASSESADRTATVTVSAEGVESVQIKVTQSLKSRIIVPQESLNLTFPGNTGGLRNIPIQTTGNKPFTATSNQDWCTATVSGFMLNISVATNIPGGPERSAEVILSAEGMDDVTISIEQSAFVGYVNIANNMHLAHHVKSETNTSVYITVLHNTPYTVTSDQTWCAITVFENETRHQIKAAIAKNETGAARTANITVTGGPEPVSITVTQDAAAHQTGFPRFAVMSDTHFDNAEGNSTTGPGESSAVKVPRAIKNLTNKGDLDAIFVVGDITDHGHEYEFQHLMEAFTNTENVPANIPVYYMLGNHDQSGSSVGGEYLYLQYTKQPMNQYLEIKGYPFITISQTGPTSWDFNHAAQRFLSESLADAVVTYPGKPIFVFTHVPPQNTCYGSSATDGWGSSVFPPLLNSYPQVIIFSGHSHFPLGDPRSIWQDQYTAVNDGSTNYSELEPGLLTGGIHPSSYNKVTEGVIVNLKDGGNAVEMERWDTRRNEEILPRWTVRAPFDGSNFANEYKGRNGLPVPVFADGSVEQITVVTTGNNTAVTFPQATDNELVHHYIVSIIDAATNSVVQTQKRFSLFYLNSETPNTLTVEFTGLPVKKQLKLEIIAVDSYYINQSEPVVKQFIIE